MAAEGHSKEVSCSAFAERMDALRLRQERKSYDKMIGAAGKNQPLRSRNFAKRKEKDSNSNDLHNLASLVQDDQDIDRFEIEARALLSTVVNILLSVLGTAVAAWYVAKPWSVERRLAVALVAALAVLISEIWLFSAAKFRSRKVLSSK